MCPDFNDLQTLLRSWYFSPLSLFPRKRLINYIAKRNCVFAAELQRVAPHIRPRFFRRTSGCRVLCAPDMASVGVFVPYPSFLPLVPTCQPRIHPHIHTCRRYTYSYTRTVKRHLPVRCVIWSYLCMLCAYSSQTPPPPPAHCKLLRRPKRFVRKIRRV